MRKNENKDIKKTQRQHKTLLSVKFTLNMEFILLKLKQY